MGCANLKTVALPLGLEIIPEGCFLESGINRIMIPDSVKTIQENAFADCKQLQEVLFTANS